MPSPLDWSKIIFKRQSRGLLYIYATSHNLYALIMAFNVQENAVFITRIFKIFPYRAWEGETLLPHPPPTRSLRSLALTLG